MATQWSIKLNSGAVLPALGLGSPVILSEVESAVDVAVRAGYRTLDGAVMYRNEREMCNALQKLYKESVVKREDLFIISKVVHYEEQTAKQDVLDNCHNALENLQTEYFDLFLIHSPISFRKGADITKLRDGEVLPYNEATVAAAWEGMEELVLKGKVKSIGVSNFSITKTEKLLKTAKIIPAINQVECHAYFQQKKLRAYLKTKGIAVQAFCSIGSPARWFIDPNDPVLLEDPVINEIATKHKATAAQVCISFLLHIGVSPIPKSGKESRIIENLKAAELVLSEDDLKRIEGIDRNQRLYLVHRMFGNHPVEDFWDTAKDDAF